MKSSIYLSFLLALASCATPTKYQSAENGKNEYGFKEEKINRNIYRVSFEGNFNTEKNTVEKYMVYRAAELAQRKGKKYLRFLDKEVETNEKVLQDVSSFNAIGAYGGASDPNYSYQYYAHNYPASSHSTPEMIEKNFKAISYVEFLDNNFKSGSLKVSSVLQKINVEKE